MEKLDLEDVYKQHSRAPKNFFLTPKPQLVLQTPLWGVMLLKLFYWKYSFKIFSKSMLHTRVDVCGSSLDHNTYIRGLSILSSAQVISNI